MGCFCPFDALACSANDIINDLSWHRLWANAPDSPALVQKSVKLLRSLQHCLLRVASCQVWHLWEVFLLSNVHIVVIIVLLMGKKQERYIKQHSIGIPQFLKSRFTINMH